MKILLMADKIVGYRITKWLLDNYPNDIWLIVATGENRILHMAQGLGKRCALLTSSDYMDNSDYDLGILAWWPSIISEPLLSLPRLGWVNTHPSLLPYGRGRHPNFWALADQEPYGVSLQKVGKGIDDGDIISQTVIPYTWEDTGKSLYLKAEDAMINLFQNTYPIIRTMNFPTYPQDLFKGSFHWGKELEPASKIYLDRNYTCGRLLDKLRARTFEGHPACWFKDDGVEYEVRVEIRRK